VKGPSKFSIFQVQYVKANAYAFLERKEVIGLNDYHGSLYCLQSVFSVNRILYNLAPAEFLKIEP